MVSRRKGHAVQIVSYPHGWIYRANQRTKKQALDIAKEYNRAGYEARVLDPEKEVLKYFPIK